MKAKITINLGGFKVLFIVHGAHYDGGMFSVTHNDEVIADGYRSGEKFIFLSINQKVELFQIAFKTEVLRALKSLCKKVI